MVAYGGRRRAAVFPDEKLTLSTEIVAGEEIQHRVLGPGLAGAFRQLGGGNTLLSALDKYIR